jgi:ABC-type bacteriocin/lantibiotic exporter with double-glycine peptidase domain/CRP-like cAMP-binding protein
MRWRPTSRDGWSGMPASDRPSVSATAAAESAVLNLPLLGFLSDELRTLVVESFVPLRFEFGETIVREGDSPDGFYVLESGLARVVKLADDGQEVSLNILHDGDCFGETGLLEGAARTVSVRAASVAQCQRLDAAVFMALARIYPSIGEAFALQTRAQRLSNFLRVHSTFARLPQAVITPMLARLTPVELEPGELAVREGDPAGPLFIVEEGRLRAFQGSGTEERNTQFLRTGDFLGELSLYRGAPRMASVQAVTRTRLLALDEDLFRELLDQHAEFRARVEEHIQIYDRSQTANVPLDFAELLPADATEAALVVDESGIEEGPAHGVAIDELAAPAGAATSGPRVRGRFRRAKFPYVRQLDEMDCGVACLAMVCRHFGRDVAPAHIRMAVGTGADGTSLRGIQRGGEHVGLDVRAIKASKDRVEQLPLPAIIHWGGNHWVVLYAIDAEHAEIADPARRSRRVGREELEAQWSGYAALPSATPRLTEAPLGQASARWLVEFVRPYRRRLLAGLALALGSAGLEMLFPVLTQQVLVHRDYSLLNVLTIGMLGVLALSLLVTMIQRRMLARIAAGIDVSTLEYITRRLFALPMSYFETRRTGDIERRLDGVREIREMLVQGGIVALTAGTQLLAALIIMFVYSWLMALLFVAVLPLYLLLMRFSSRRIAPTFEGLQEEFARFRSRQIDGIKGIATVKAMGAEEGLRRLLVDNVTQLSQRAFRSDFTLMAYEGVISVVTFVLVVVFLFIGAHEVLAHDMSVGELVSFNALVLLAIAPLSTLLGVWDRWQMSRVLLGRVQDIFDYRAEQDADEGSYLPVRSLQGAIAIRGASFHFPNSPSAAVLSEITINIEPGTVVAIVGRSGSGKSTLVKCLAGLMPLTGGSIAYDGIDLRQLRLRDLRRRIGCVLQEPYLFDDTIATNIAFGEQEPEPERLRWAAEVANALDFVERLPLGFETRIGESGMHLSGGQAQRISIARALYQRPPVLILDEATSALDSESERIVKQNLDRMLEGRTAIIVAHRLSTIRDADMILVLEAGRLVESGNHEQLMANEGLYYYLISQQLA